LTLWCEPFRAIAAAGGRRYASVIMSTVLTTLPTIETARLRLRPFRTRDAPAVERLAGEHAVADTTLNIPHPYRPGMAVAWIETHGPAFERRELATFAIDRRDDGDLVGAISLRIRQAMGRAELGYWVGRPYWNRGYGTEGARAALDFAFGALGLHRVHAMHMTRNPASGRVMQKIGMRLEGVLRNHVRKWDVFEDVAIYGILEDEHAALADGATPVWAERLDRAPPGPDS
jgi:[ribosomal protein S5]-alanine N-acetyltransferase